MRLSSVVSALVLFAFLPACSGGGGGGGSGFVGAANVSIDVSPGSIDTGDRSEVRVQISDVHPNGIILKIRFPTALTYVLNSAVLEVSGDEVDISPAVSQTDNNDNYLVFFLPQDSFGSEGEESGTVVVQLEGAEDTSSGKVEVDADVDDPLINNDVEFNISEPEFAAEDERSIEVNG